MNQTMAADSKNKNALMGKNVKETVKNGVILGSLLSAVTGFTKIYKKVADENRAREIYKLRFGSTEKKQSPIIKLFNNVKAGVKKGAPKKKEGGILGIIGTLFAFLFGGGGPFKTILKVLGWVGKGVWAIIKVVGKLLWKVIKWVIPKIWKFIKWIGKLVGKLLGKLWNLIKGPLMKMFGKLIGVLKKGLDFLVKIVGKLFGKLFGKLGKGLGKLGKKFGGKLFNKFGSKFGSKFGGKFGGKLVSKLGGKVGGKMGGKLLTKGLGKVGGKLLGKIGGKVAAKGAAKFAAKAALKGGAKLALRAGAGALKAIPGVGIAATLGMAAFDAIDGWKNASSITGKAEKDLTTGDRAKAAGASALSGLTFGLVSSKTMYKGINAVTGGIGKAFGFAKKIGGGLFKGAGKIGKTLFKWSPLGLAARAGKGLLGALTGKDKKAAQEQKKILLLTKMTAWIVAIGKAVLGIAGKMGIKVKAPVFKKGKPKKQESTLKKIGKGLWNVAKWTPAGMAIQGASWLTKGLFGTGKKKGGKVDQKKQLAKNKKPAVKKPTTLLDFVKIITRAVLAIAKKMGAKVNTKLRVTTKGKKAVGTKGAPKKKTSLLGRIGKGIWNVAKWTPHGMAIQAGMWAGKKLLGVGKKGVKKLKNVKNKILQKRKPLSLLGYIRIITKAVLAIAKVMGAKVNLKKAKSLKKGDKGAKKKTSLLGRIGKGLWNVAKWTPHGMAARAGLWAGKKLFGAGKKGAQKLGIIKKPIPKKADIKKQVGKKPLSLLGYIRIITKAVLAIAKKIGVKFKSKKASIMKKGAKGAPKKKTSLLGRIGKGLWNVAKWTPHGMAARAGLWAGKKLFGAGKKGVKNLKTKFKLGIFKKGKGQKLGFFGRIGSLLSKGPFGIIKRIISRILGLIRYARIIARAVIGIAKKVGAKIKKKAKAVANKAALKQQNIKKIFIKDKNQEKTLSTKSDETSSVVPAKVAPPIIEAKTAKTSGESESIPTRKLGSEGIKSKTTGISISAQHVESKALNAQKAKSASMSATAQKSEGNTSQLNIDIDEKLAKLPILIAKGITLWKFSEDAAVHAKARGDFETSEDGSDVAEKWRDAKMGALASLQD